MTVSAFSSLSLSPPLVLFCVDHAASMHDLLLGHPRFGVSILSSGQEAYSRRFADTDGARSERFDGIAYSRGDADVVLLDEALAHLECRITDTLEGGDHVIHVGRIEHAETHDGEPLLYYQGKYRRLVDR